MESAHVRRFTDPDDAFRGTGLETYRVTLGAHIVSRAVHHPGWRYSTYARTIGANEWCQTHHVGYAVSGSCHVILSDGREMEISGGDVFEIPPGHDGWVTSNEPYVTVDWVGARAWLSERTNAASTLATIMFTDVVDSSGEARRRGDVAWTDLNTALGERTRDVVLEFGGEVVKSTGDGVLAVFGSAARGVRCALELARMAPELGLTIRVGLHTGEIESVAGDVHGISVHEAARVMAEADPGEVLVSEVTRVVASGIGLGFTDRGVRDLKGIGERRLHAVYREASVSP